MFYCPTQIHEDKEEYQHGKNRGNDDSIGARDSEEYPY
jgi:hypothetical protein